ncbi:unnamed protein product [Caenorhabditis angaria]|uniref:ATP-grasp domain-containing protein n=1 Tax=Caenorhabditis angaria TaxID=860376 RepID=A0A9P1J0G7_9PELO|nr:unnamed protein product [Caenorhabditis angaria]
MQNYSIIIVLWKYRLNLFKWKKRENVRIIVVAPPRMLVDETNVDVYYQVEPPIRDHDHCLLMNKVRELCSIFATSKRRLIVFERSLQRRISQIRRDMEIEGFLPDEMLPFLHSEEVITYRNGLSALSLRQCSLSGTPQPDSWAQAVQNQIGGFPAVVRPLRHHCAHSVGFVRNENEFRKWFRRNSSVHVNEHYLVHEYMQNGHEFSAICSHTDGLLGSISSLDTKRSVLEAIQHQKPYTLQSLSANQTRDVFPGLESFTLQVIRSVLPNGYIGVIFIRGYYKDHNEIFFQGLSLEPDSETSRQLFAMPSSLPWEVMTINAQLTESTKSEIEDADRDKTFYSVVNFPSAEGVLIHQTSIHKRSSEMRVSWRSAESGEMKDSDHLDDNVLQVFLWNQNRDELLADCEDVKNNTDITIDRNALNERHTLCRKNIAARLNAREFVRSCTTAD